MNLCVKSFDELSTRELYEILRVRSEIFVVEQNCVYQDLDGRDEQSLHIYLEEDGKVWAYLRAFPLEGQGEIVQAGRVLTVIHGTGLGGRLLKEGLLLIEERMHPRQILIEAQTYAAGFYAREGFIPCSEEFLEDGIPHIRMIRDCCPREGEKEGEDEKE